ncbi:MAG: o-succinylbenzoate synthase [Tannerella sp.]|jgi:o-succinylbenzoate synthase|nr:o-succinylbenzoate synthase [Tannerella sp.]
MNLKTKIIPYTLIFKQQAHTSRGVYHERKVWYIKIFEEKNPDRFGIGECAPLPDLSCDYCAEYEEILSYYCYEFEKTRTVDFEKQRNTPSILFGLETAILHYESKSYKFFDTPFSRSEKAININGLIWMGDADFMKEQIDNKINNGFTCIKLKIGGINFDEELKLLQYIRSQYSENEIIIRLDANGAFSPVEALEKLKRLSDFQIHSIEQPIKAGQWDILSELCANTPIPIALDEELIGINSFPDKKKLIENIHPQYIVIKPSLHGGIWGSKEWIKIAEEHNVGWWITSALESNIGLNSIAQWCAKFDNPLHQGLGTGDLYENNFPLPLVVNEGQLRYRD